MYHSIYLTHLVVGGCALNLTLQGNAQTVVAPDLTSLARGVPPE